MLIATYEKQPGRTHNVAGTDYTFNPAPGSTEPMVCEVDDPAALAVLLHPRNANLFYSLDAPATLTRAAVAATSGATSAADLSFDLSLLDQSVRAIREVLPNIDDQAQLNALLAAEQAGQARKTVIADIAHRMDAVNGAAIEGGEAISEAKAQAGLILDNEPPVILSILESVTEPAIVAAMLELEQAGQARSAVLDRLTQLTSNLDPASA